MFLIAVDNSLRVEEAIQMDAKCYLTVIEGVLRGFLSRIPGQINALSFFLLGAGPVPGEPKA